MPNTDLTPANGMQGSSSIYGHGMSPNTRVVTSQKVRILASAYGDNKALSQMGVLSNFGVNHSRQIEPVRGIGFGDKVAELVPGVSEPVTVDLEKALMYLCNLWQAVGYAAGIDGGVRMLAHHKWPFDLEQQVVFSTLADRDLERANVGYNGTVGGADGGVRAIQYPAVTNIGGYPGEERGHSALITMYEACWFNSYSSQYQKDTATVLETGNVTVTDVHDFASVYGEFMATGLDPTRGQLSSIRFAGDGGKSAGAASFAMGGGGQSRFELPTNTAS